MFSGEYIYIISVSRDNNEYYNVLPTNSYKRAKQILEEDPGFADDGYYRYALITQLKFETWSCIDESFFKYNIDKKGYEWVGKVHKLNLHNLWQ